MTHHVHHVHRFASDTDLQYMKYVMVPAPDNVLIELFEVNRALIPEEYHLYFEI